MSQRNLCHIAVEMIVMSILVVYASELVIIIFGKKKTSKQVALPPFKTNPAFCQIIEGSVEWGVEKVHTDKNSSSWIPG